MGVGDEADPISDDELLYRRIPVNLGWYSLEGGLTAGAFGPHRKNDQTGLSLSRSKYKSIEEAAKGQPEKAYYVGTLRAGDLRQNGIEVIPRPEPGDPGHTELPGLNSENRKASLTLELQETLVKLTIRVDGPFGPS